MGTPEISLGLSEPIYKSFENQKIPNKVDSVMIKYGFKKGTYDIGWIEGQIVITLKGVNGSVGLNRGKDYKKISGDNIAFMPEGEEKIKRWKEALDKLNLKIAQVHEQTHEQTLAFVEEAHLPPMPQLDNHTA